MLKIFGLLLLSVSLGCEPSATKRAEIIKNCPEIEVCFHMKDGFGHQAQCLDKYWTFCLNKPKTPEKLP